MYRATEAVLAPLLEVTELPVRLASTGSAGGSHGDGEPTSGGDGGSGEGGGNAGDGNGGNGTEGG